MANPTVSLLLGVHNHQPVDNWDYVIQEATDKCYRPFLELLYKHPGVKMSVHYTGYLLNWLAEKHPELITLLKTMVERGQVEVFTGGMYEPIMAIIPDADKLEQIETLTRRIKELFKVDPKGMWLAERVWEPHLVKYMAEAGVKYICLDDSHFNSVGLDDVELLGRYTSEEQGKTVDIFPVSKAMRYLIPYAQPDKIMEYLHSVASPEGNRAAIYFDDGEKFGVWPGTYKAVYT
jgi:4-alpha-glucanotransferase